MNRDLEDIILGQVLTRLLTKDMMYVEVNEDELIVDGWIHVNSVEADIIRRIRSGDDSSIRDDSQDI